MRYAIVVLAACSLAGEKGSGKQAHETRQVGAFDEIDLAGACDLDAQIGTTPSVEVTGDDNLVKLVTTEVEGHALRIRTTKNVRPTMPLVVHVVAPHVTRVTVSGAGKASLTGVTGGDLTLDVSGAGSLVATGTASHVTATLSGAGAIRATDLHAERVDVDLSGAGDADVFASAALTATVSGAGSVHYAGNPKDVKKQVSGAGSVSAR